MIRITSIVQGFGLLLAGIATAVMLCMVAGSRDASQPYVPVLVWVAVTLVPIFFIEGGIAWIRRGLVMSEEKMGIAPPQTVFSPFARFLSVIAKFGAIGSLFVFFVIAAGFVWFTGKLSPVFSDDVALYSVLGTLAGYLIIRWPLFAFFKKLGVLWRKVMPSYTLTPDSIIINLNMVSIGSKSKQVPQTVTIRFNELDTVQAMTWAEAAAYEKFQLGTDPVLQLQSATSMYKFMKGEIDKPTVYMQVQGAGPSLLLKGPNLAYLFTVANQNVDDLLQAFAASKKIQSNIV